MSFSGAPMPPDMLHRFFFILLDSCCRYHKVVIKLNADLVMQYANEEAHASLYHTFYYFNYFKLTVFLCHPEYFALCISKYNSE